MTDRTTVLDDPATGLPPAWWARGLTLSERLAVAEAPGSRPEARVGFDALRAAPRDPGHPDGFAARLVALGVVGASGATAAAGEPTGRVHEAPEYYADRVVKPRWAATIEAAVESAPEKPAPAADGDPTAADIESADAAEVFAPVLRPLVDAAWREAAPRLTLPAAEHPVVRAAFERRLAACLARCAGRALVSDLHAARRAGLLAGPTPHARFAAFTAAVGTRSGLAGLFARYPVLARMVGQSCSDAVQAVLEVADRLRQDREDLAAELFAGSGPLVLTALEVGLGDAHQGGRTVARLSFGPDREAVYKPRPLGQHALLDALAAWLGARLPDLAPRTPRCLLRDGYGWQEFVAHRPCASLAEADRFYRRQGALLALLYAVNGVDMHYENVIAAGDQPVLVDCETLLHGGLPPATTAGEDPAAVALQASVYRTCLLPTTLLGEEGALDVSALGHGHSGREAWPTACLRWEAAGTDEMRAVRTAAAVPPAANQPLPSGRRGTAVGHHAALMAGFRAVYDTVCAHRGELVGPGGVLAADAATPARLIVRPSRLYATLLEESNHPDLLGDALARDAVFATLWAESAYDPARLRLVEHEIADLWRGDVPLFTHLPDGTAVWASTGAGLDAVLPGPALAGVEAKVAAMGEVDRHDQEWVIAAALAAGAGTGPGRLATRPAGQPFPVTAPAGPGRLLAAATGVADGVVARAVHGGGRANWLGLEHVAGEHWAVLPMGAGLAQGYTGVAVFLAQTGALTGAERYIALAAAAVRPLPALLRALALDPDLARAGGPGALDGVGGIVHALLRLRALLGAGVLPDGQMDECLDLALTALWHTVAEPEAGSGLAGGVAGALSAAAAARRATGWDAAARVADGAADVLLGRVGERSVSTAQPGFAHGDAGIGWALLSHAAPDDAASAPGSGRETATSASRVGRRLVETALDVATSQLADAAPGPTGDLSAGRGSWSAGFWGSGLPGVLLAAASLPEVLDRRAEEVDLVAALESGLDALPAGDLSLRRGALGAVEALSLLASRGRRGAAPALARRAAEFLGTVEALGPGCGTPGRVPSPGLLDGSSGIGYGLLRLAHPDEVPPLLSLGSV